MGLAGGTSLPAASHRRVGHRFLVRRRDRPSDVGLPAYSEDDAISRDAETAAEGRAHGLTAYLHLLSNWRFFVACQVKGLDNVVRYGIVSWAPIYYVQVGGFDLDTMAWITFAYPVGYLLAPLSGGTLSDLVFRSNRSIVVAIAGAASGVLMLGIAVSPADHAILAAVLLFFGGSA